MADDDATAGRRRGMTTRRMEAFSDGVFAIAITLLILDIAVPEDSSDDVLRAIANEWPSYLAYVVSFATIGAVWLAHSAITEYLDRADATLIRLNLLLLLVVSFIPFPTHLLAQYQGHPDAERVSVTIYGVNLLMASVLVWGLWRYAVAEHLVRPDAQDEEVQVLTKRLTPSLTAYVVLIGVGLFLPLVAVLGFLTIALYLIVPVGVVRRRQR